MADVEAGDDQPTPPEAPHWSYSGPTGPDQWDALDSLYELCGAGEDQTPIDIPANVTPGVDHALSFHYRSSALTLLNDGHAVQANYDSGSHIRLNETDFELLQFHFHAPSEHTVAGKSYPIELHLVHRSDAGDLAVVGLFIEEGAANTALANVFDNAPTTVSAAARVGDETIDAAQFLPEQLWAWRYAGSLTTPPCTEGVHWTVLAQPITASAAQIAALTSIYADNGRPIQDLNGRVIAGAHYAYEGESGPEHWGELAPTWGACETGAEQSPIDIPASVSPKPFSGLEFDYKPSALNIVNSGHTVQVDYESGSAINLAGRTYDLLQFHFHAHSEHTLAGRSAPMELHLVHRDAGGALAVVGVMIEAGDHNDALDAVLSNMPEHVGAPVAIAEETVDAATLLPSDLAMWRYDGSLTTPPCSEGVSWHVISAPISASEQQIAAFTQLYPANARPVAPLGSRTIQ